VLRSKGILRLKGVTTPVVVHGVQHVVHAPSHLAEWPEGRPLTRLVLIGRDLHAERLERSFRLFMRLGAGPGASAPQKLSEMAATPNTPSSSPASATSPLTSLSK
jgi:hypothetical protein